MKSSKKVEKAKGGKGKEERDILMKRQNTSIDTRKRRRKREKR